MPGSLRYLYLEGFSLTDIKGTMMNIHMKRKKSSANIEVKIDPDLKQLIPGYLENRRTDFKAISRSLETNDFATIKDIGHNMKGSGMGYGFDTISEIGASLESSALESDSEKIRESLDHLTDFLNRVKVIYRNT